MNKNFKDNVITCVSNSHQIYADNFKANRVKIGKSYKCVEDITLTSEDYYVKEFAALQGVTIKSTPCKYGWSMPCLPKSCFRLATKKEIRKYVVGNIVNEIIAFTLNNWHKCIVKIDRVVRANHYKKLDEQIEKYF